MHYEGSAVSFMRNCGCGSTLCVNVDEETFGMDHVLEKAEQEGRNVEDILNEHRAIYNLKIKQN